MNQLFAGSGQFELRSISVSSAGIVESNNLLLQHYKQGHHMLVCLGLPTQTKCSQSSIRHRRERDRLEQWVALMLPCLIKTPFS